MLRLGSLVRRHEKEEDEEEGKEYGMGTRLRGISYLVFRGSHCGYGGSGGIASSDVFS